MRIGKLKISVEWFENGNLLRLGFLFKEFIPVHIDMNEFYDIKVYTGYCSQFDDIKKGDPIPFYNAIINNESNEVKFEKF